MSIMTCYLRRRDVHDPGEDGVGRCTHVPPLKQLSGCCLRLELSNVDNNVVNEQAGFNARVFQLYHGL